MVFIIIGAEALFILTTLMFFVDEIREDNVAQCTCFGLSFLLFIVALGLYLRENEENSCKESISQIVYDNGVTIDSIVVFKSK